jgi:hypothetical protein
MEMIWQKRIESLRDYLAAKGFSLEIPNGHFAPTALLVNKKRLYSVQIQPWDSGATLFVSSTLRKNAAYATIAIFDRGGIHLSENFERLLHDD